MTNTHDNVSCWRDLADQLTAEQVGELEYCEREQIPPGLASPQGHLNAARAMIRHNLVQSMCADIPLPADAIGDISDWDHLGGDEYSPPLHGLAPLRRHDHRGDRRRPVQHRDR